MKKVYMVQDGFDDQGRSDNPRGSDGNLLHPECYIGPSVSIGYVRNVRGWSCPFCDDGSLRIELMEPSPPYEEYAVICENCCFHGPWARTEIAAVERVNDAFKLIVKSYQKQEA